MVQLTNRLFLTATIAFIAAGVAAIALLLLSLVWFVVVLLVCAALAIGAAATIRKGEVYLRRDAMREAHTARLADLNQQAEALKEREHAVENAQMAVLEQFRREHEL